MARGAVRSILWEVTAGSLSFPGASRTTALKYRTPSGNASRGQVYSKIYSPDNVVLSASVSSVQFSLSEEPYSFSNDTAWLSFAAILNSMVSRKADGAGEKPVIYGFTSSAVVVTSISSEASPRLPSVSYPTTRNVYAVSGTSPVMFIPRILLSVPIVTNSPSFHCSTWK